MKYVMLLTKHAGCDQLVPIIFPNQLVHSIVAKALIRVLKQHGKEEVVVRSAGTITMGEVNCSGKSSTLKVLSDVDDDTVVRMYDYMHGLGFEKEGE